MNEDVILFQYQVKTKSQYGTRFYYFYADTDIENYLNDKNIKYVRYAKDTALNKKEKRIKELFKENKHYKRIIDELEKWLEDYLKTYGYDYDKIRVIGTLNVVGASMKVVLDKLQELKGSDKNE